MKKKKLTNKQLTVMKILWSHPEPLMASEILKYDPSLNINTIQACLRILIKSEYIKVANITYSGTVLSRCYSPIVTKEEYLKESQMDIAGSAATVMAALIESETDLDELHELEMLIERKKAEIKGE